MNFKQLKEINDKVNKLKYVVDDINDSTTDIWKTPLEFYADGEGDCEDFAIAKYFMLKGEGVPTDQLRISHVSLMTPLFDAPLPHMVLCYYEKNNETPLVLDSIEKEILYLNLRKELNIVYQFNEDYTFIDNKPVHEAGNITQWDFLLRRREAEIEDLETGDDYTDAPWLG